MSKNNIIPSHWQECKLQEIGKIINGDRGKNYPSRAHYVSSGIPFISAGNIEHNFIDTNNLNFITEQKFNALNNGKLKEGDIIYCIRGSLGKCSIFNLEKGAISSSLCILRLNSDMLGKFVYYYLCSPFGRDEILKHDNGTAQPNLSAKNFSNYIIFKPPLTEQQAIVSKIEEHLSDLENGKQQLQTAQLQLKVYRQSLLKAAFEGKLTNKDIKDGELPKGWRWKELKEITSALGDGLHGTPKYSENGNYFFINGNNLTDGKIEIKDNTKRVSIKEYEKYKKPLNEKTILVSINGTLGYTAFFNNEKVILGKSACYFNVIDIIDKHYIRYYLTSNNFISYANKNATGSTIKNVGLKAMREFKVIIPPTIEEQTLIVRELENKLTICDKIEEIISQNMQQTETLRQSILKRAFEGKLI